MRLRHRAIDNIDMDLFWPTSIPEHVVRNIITQISTEP